MVWAEPPTAPGSPLSMTVALAGGVARVTIVSKIPDSAATKVVGFIPTPLDLDNGLLDRSELYSKVYATLFKSICY